MTLTTQPTEGNSTFTKGGPPPLKPRQPSRQRRLSRRQKATFIAIIFSSWALTFTAFADTGISPIRAPSSSEFLLVDQFSCTDAFWPSAEKCGKHGVNCLPDVSGKFDPKTLAFHCPANCVRDGHSVSADRPHLAGDQDISTAEPVVIGGPVYRGDSQLCAAAVHAGILDDEKGGCGLVKRMSQTNSFPGEYMHNVQSFAVETYFPLTFRFPITENEEMAGECPAVNDRKWALPWVSVGHTVLVFGVTSSTVERAAWVASVAVAHLFTWRSTLAKSVTYPPAVQDVRQPVPIPEMLDPKIFGQTLKNSISNITFSWATPTPRGVEGISMLVNDVERERIYFSHAGDKKTMFWQRGPQAFVDYIRFGYVQGGKVMAYSPAGTWFLNDTWSGINPEDREIRIDQDSEARRG